MGRFRSKPLVGITGPDKGGMIAWLFAALAVYRAGGRPRRIRPRRPLKIGEVDALIIGGGADIDPSLYGGEKDDVLAEVETNQKKGRHPVLGRMLLPFIYVLRRLFSLRKPVGNDPERDSLEVSLVREAVEQGKPILGICRGSQMLNAALGGSLHREVRGFYTETPYIKSVLPRKKISVIPQTLLASLWPGTHYRVNALNHQAVSRIAPSLRVAATEDNGLVQAIESPSLPFLLGVQWHPEFLPHIREQQVIFRKLVQCAVRPS